MNARIDFVDFHAHVLPGVDHGCDSLETARKQLMLAKSAGVDRVVITPHFYPHVDSVDDFIQRRNEAYALVLEDVQDNPDYPDIRLGCELLICEGISNLPRIDEFCIRNTKTLLLELPFSDFSQRYVDDVKTLTSSGYDVVLAHADRYQPENIDRLIAVGARIQLNADSFCGMFLPRVIERWLLDGHVVAIGSDIHMTDAHAYRRFAWARRLLSKKYRTVALESDEIWKSSEK